MSAVCQWLILAGLALRLIAALYTANAGREALKPTGFAGTLTAVIVVPLIALMYWKAGAFSLIVGGP